MMPSRYNVTVRKSTKQTKPSFLYQTQHIQFVTHLLTVTNFKVDVFNKSSRSCMFTFVQTVKTFEISSVWNEQFKMIQVS